MTTGSAKLFAACLTVIAGTATAATLRVPQTYPTIQSAVDAAQPNDTVLVGPGTYFERVVITRSVKLLSTLGASRTAIDANHHGSAVKIDGSANPALRATVSGFTLTHGEFIFPPTGEEPDTNGTGIYVKSASADINHDIVEDNFSCTSGIFAFGPKISVTDSIIRNNSGTEICFFRGSGIGIGGGFDQEAVIERNEIYGNASSGINVGFVGKLSIRNNHVHHNNGTQQPFGAGMIISTVNGVIENNLVEHNNAARGVALSLTMERPEDAPPLSLLVTGNTMLHNDPVPLNDGDPSDGSVVAISDLRGSSVKFIANTVIGSSPAALVFCDDLETHPVLFGNVLVNYAGPKLAETCPH